MPNFDIILDGSEQFVLMLGLLIEQFIKTLFSMGKHLAGVTYPPVCLNKMLIHKLKYVSFGSNIKMRKHNAELKGQGLI